MPTVAVMCTVPPGSATCARSRSRRRKRSAKAAALAAVGARQDDHELVAAVAAHRIRGARALRQQLGHQLEHAITHQVAVGVVDFLEVVGVDEQHAQRMLIALGVGDRARQRLVEVAAVVQAGQGVARHERCARARRADGR